MTQPPAFVNNDYCFACGSLNPLGLRLTFFESATPAGVRQLCTRVVASPHWQGFQGVLHGGLQSTIIDDLMSNHLFRLEQTWAATAELKLRFKRPVPLGPELLFTSQVLEHSGRVWTMRAECRLYGEPEAAALTTGEGRFVEIPRS